MNNASIEMSVYFGDTPVTIRATSIIDALKKKSIIENLNTAVTQEGMDLQEVTPIYYETKEGYEYVGFEHLETGARVTFGKTREVPEDKDAQLFPKRMGSENYTGFRKWDSATSELQPV